MELQKMVPLNWTLIKQPLNWIIVLLMVVLGVFILEIVLQYIKTFNVNKENTNG